MFPHHKCDLHCFFIYLRVLLYSLKCFILKEDNRRMKIEQIPNSRLKKDGLSIHIFCMHPDSLMATFWILAASVQLTIRCGCYQYITCSMVQKIAYKLKLNQTTEAQRSGSLKLLVSGPFNTLFFFFFFFGPPAPPPPLYTTPQRAFVCVDFIGQCFLYKK